MGFRRSAIMCGAPRRAGAPAIGAAAHGAALFPCLDMADARGGFACNGQGLRDFRHVLFAHDQHHAYTAVKGASHFLRLDIALRLQESHQARLFPAIRIDQGMQRSEEHTSELQSLMRISYAVFCLKKKKKELKQKYTTSTHTTQHTVQLRIYTTINTTQNC